MTLNVLSIAVPIVVFSGMAVALMLMLRVDRQERAARKH